MTSRQSSDRGGLRRSRTSLGCAPRGCSSMAEHQLPKLTVRVRFSSPAPVRESAAQPANQLFDHQHPCGLLGPPMPDRSALACGLTVSARGGPCGRGSPRAADLALAGRANRPELPASTNAPCGSLAQQPRHRLRRSACCRCVEDHGRAGRTAALPSRARAPATALSAPRFGIGNTLARAPSRSQPPDHMAGTAARRRSLSATSSSAPIVPLATAAPIALPAVASHAIG
jgi:hypothetical protein